MLRQLSGEHNGCSNPGFSKFHKHSGRPRKIIILENVQQHSPIWLPIVTNRQQLAEMH